MQKSPWKTTIGSLIIAFCLYTLGGIAADITGFVNDVKDGFSLLSMFAGGDEGGWKPDIGDVIEWMFMTFVILGYLLFFSSLKRFARMQDAEADREQLLRVRTGYILLLLAAVAGFIPVIGWIASLVLFIVGYVKLIGGYGKLKRSTTFADPYNGAGLLRGASIWLLVGAILGIIPLIGGILETITAIVAFFMTLAGWRRIKQGDPLPAEVWEQRGISVYNKQSIATWWSVLLGVVILNIIMGCIPREIKYQLFITGNGFNLLYLWYLAFYSISILSTSMILRTDSKLKPVARTGVGLMLFLYTINFFHFCIWPILVDILKVGEMGEIPTYTMIYDNYWTQMVILPLLYVTQCLLLFIGNPYNRTSRYLFLGMAVVILISNFVLGYMLEILNIGDEQAVVIRVYSHNVCSMLLHLALLISIVLWSKEPERISSERA